MTKAMTRSELSLVQRYRRLWIFCAFTLVTVGLLMIKPIYLTGAPYHKSLEYSGVLLIVVAIMVRLWCILYIGGRKASFLMQDGPYSLSRNPLYVGSIIGAVGLGCQTGMLSFALLFGLLAWAIFLFVVRQEERYLEHTFGAHYSAYMMTTPRFFPKFSRYTDGGTRYEFDPNALGRTLRDGSLMLLAIPFTEIIEEMHEADLLPVLLTSL